MGNLFGEDEQKSKSSSTTSADPVYTQGYKNLYGQAQQVANTPYNEAANKTIAGFTGPQTQGFGQVQQNLGNYQPVLGQAVAYGQQGASGVTGQDIANYSNPFQQGVIDATQNQFNTNNARSAQTIAGNNARSYLTGSTGKDVAQALQSEANQNAQNPVIAQLNAQNYTQAVNNAQADKSRALQGSANLGNLAGQTQAYGNTDVASLMASGNQQQQQQQNVNDAASANAAAQSGYSAEMLSWLAKINAGGAGLSQSTTGTQTQSGGGSGLGQMIGTGLSLFSMLKDGGRVNGYAEGGAVDYGYQPQSYVPKMESPQSGIHAGQAPSIGSQTQGSGVSQGMGEVLNSFKAAQGAMGGAQRAFGKANTSTDANGWATTSQPQSASGWGNWLGNGGLGSMFGFAEGGRVDDEAGLGNVFSDLQAMDSPVMQAGAPRPLVAPTETGSIQAVPQGPAPEAPKEKSGLFGLNFSDPTRQGLLAAGLGIMGSRSRVPAMAIGQGGLQGLGAYNEATQQEAANAYKKQQMAAQAQELSMRQAAAQREIEMQPYKQRLTMAQAIKAERDAAGGGMTDLQKNYEYAVKNGFKGSLVDFQHAAKGQAEARNSLNPIWGEDANGNPAILQLNTQDNQARAVTLPDGMKINKGVEKLDGGDKWILIDKVTRQKVGEESKNVDKEAALKEAGTEQGKAKQALGQVYNMARTVNKTLADVEEDPYLDNMVGPLDSRLPNTSKEAGDLQAKIDQVQGQAFLAAYAGLRGGGAITDIEGAKATAAYSRLANMTGSEDGYKQALKDFHHEVNELVKVAQMKAGVDPVGFVQTATPEEAAKLPPGTPFMTTDGRIKYVPAGPAAGAAAAGRQ